jgi:hypothetical protein
MIKRRPRPTAGSAPARPHAPPSLGRLDACPRMRSLPGSGSTSVSTSRRLGGAPRAKQLEQVVRQADQHPLGGHFEDAAEREPPSTSILGLPLAERAVEVLSVGIRLTTPPSHRPILHEIPRGYAARGGRKRPFPHAADRESWWPNKGHGPAECRRRIVAGKRFPQVNARGRF